MLICHITYYLFQSTPPSLAETVCNGAGVGNLMISIHSAIASGDAPPEVSDNHPAISIHSAIASGDMRWLSLEETRLIFQSTPPSLAETQICLLLPR